jgi:hypothetical protein
MNPKNNIKWKQMKELSRKNFNKIKFERVNDGTFVEDNTELTVIGREIINILKDNISDKKIKFVDICGAPGNYSKLVLDNFESSGIGISLSPKEGGVEFEMENYPNYKVIYSNILKDNSVEINKINLGMASCVSYEVSSKNSFQLNLKLILKSLIYLIDNLDNNGNIVINLTIKNIYFAFNIIYVLSKLFQKTSIWKSSKVWADKNTFYFFGFGYQNNNKYYQKLIEIRNILSNNNFIKNIYFNKILMNENNFNIIDDKMNKIYQVKIDHFNN